MNETVGPATTVPSRLIAFVGSYGTGLPIVGGGIDVFEVGEGGKLLSHLSRVDQPKLAGHLAYAPNLGVLYAVDERKTDGRGPVEPPAGVHAFAVDPSTAALTWLGSRTTPGPRPSYVAVVEAKRALLTANHGDFDHVERVVQTGEGRWEVEYLYDDSTVVQLRLAPDGSIAEIQHVEVLSGHGPDPNASPQAGGHAQASPHAHCAAVDPSGEHVLVCDKSTGRIYVYRVGDRLALASTFQLPEHTGPRHLAFDPITGRAYVTCELSSELASFDFDPEEGELSLLHRVSTLAPSYGGGNEPAEVRVHPKGGFVYVNNRGEDSVAWFRVTEDGRLTRLGHVPLSKSIHPGLAARSFTFAPSGDFMLVADRSGDLLRSYAVDREQGGLVAIAEWPLANPAYVVFAELPDATRCR